MTQLSLDDAHCAAQCIERDGPEAFHTVSDLYGRDTALVLLVAHIRRSLGSMDGYPPRVGIKSETNKVLDILDIQKKDT